MYVLEEKILVLLPKEILFEYEKKTLFVSGQEQNYLALFLCLSLFKYSVSGSKTWKILKGSSCLFAKFLSKFVPMTWSPYSTKHIHFYKLFWKTNHSPWSSHFEKNLKIENFLISWKWLNICLFFFGVEYFLCRPTTAGKIIHINACTNKAICEHSPLDRELWLNNAILYTAIMRKRVRKHG